MASHGGIHDIHICGACRSEFTDINQFIQHKKECYLSAASNADGSAASCRSRQIIQPTDPVGLESQLSTLCNETYQENNAFAYVGLENPVSTQQKPEATFKTDHQLGLDQHLPSRQELNHYAITVNPNFNTNLKKNTNASSEQFSYSLLPRCEVKLASNITQQDKDLSVVTNATNRETEDSVVQGSISADDIAVYVVSPKSFASSVEDQTKFNDRLRNEDQGSSKILNVWANSTLSSSSSQENSNLPPYYSDSLKTTPHLEVTNCVTRVHNNSFQMAPVTGSSFYIDGNLTPSSDNSTPCPEDLEVGQISAAMLDKKSELEHHKTYVGRRKNVFPTEDKIHPHTDLSQGKSQLTKTTDLKAKLMTDEANGVCGYTRENTASAPIIKGCSDGHSKKSFMEKRVRLQGISDDLLTSSPFFDASNEDSKIQIAFDAEKKLTEVSALSDKSSQPATLSVKSSAVITPALTSYKAIFTSPSSAGHRLTPTHTGHAEPIPVCKEILLNSCHFNANSQLSNSSRALSSQALVLKNISGSVVRQDSEHKPNSKFITSPEIPQRKTERHLIFEEVETSVTRDTVITEQATNLNYVASAASYQKKKDISTVENLSDNDYLNQTSSAGPEGSTDVNSVAADISQLTSVPLPSTASANQSELDNYSLVRYASGNQNTGAENQTSLEMMSANGECQFSSTAITDSGSASSSKKTEIAPIDDNSVIMVYKNSDGSVIMVPKSMCSSLTALPDAHHAASVFPTDTFTADGSVVSFGQDHQNYLLKQDLHLQQNSDSGIYVDLVNSDDTELPHQHQLMQNLSCTGFSQPNQTHLLKSSDGATTFCVNLCPTVSADDNCTNVDVLKLNSASRQPSSRQKGSDNSHEEREKFIMKPKKTSGSSQSSATRQPWKKIARPLKGDLAVPFQAPPLNEVSVRANAGEGQDNKKERLFICKFDDCRYTTGLYKDFQRHYRTHTGERPFKCDECGKMFNRSDKLRIHLRWHAGKKPFQCQLCNYASLEGGSLKKHMRIHTDERPFKCQICSYASRNSSQLIVHLRTHTGDSPFHCTMCTAQFKMNSDLKRHLRVHTGEKPFQCDSCNYKSSNKGNLKTHIRINHSKENEMRCPKCEFVTSSKKRLRDHVKTHDSNRVVRCTQCEYTCISLSALRNHASIHNAVKPYRCSYCPYSSNQSGNLKKHVQNLHHDKLQQSRHEKHNATANISNNRQENVVVSVEEKPGRRRQHRNTQNYRKRHRCQECGSGFVREDSLRCHMKQHVEEGSLRGEIARHPQRACKEFQTNNTGNQAISIPTGRQGIQHIVAAAKFFEEHSGSTDLINNSSTLDFQSQSLQDSGNANTSSQIFNVSSGECGKESTLLPKPEYSQHSSGGNSTTSNDTKSLQRISHQLPWEHRSYTLSVPPDEEDTDKTAKERMIDSASTKPRSKLLPHSPKTDNISNAHPKHHYKPILSQNSNEQISPQKSVSQLQSFHPHKKRKVTKSPLGSSLSVSTKSFQVVNKNSQPSHQSFQQQSQIVLQQAVPPINSTIEVSGIPGMEPTLVFTQQPGSENTGNSEPAFNIQLVPQVSTLQQGSSQTRTLNQEILQQLSLQVVPQVQPATQIQIVLPGATVPNSTEVIQGGRQTFLPQQQQIMLQVQNGCDQPQEMITIPLNQLASQSQVSPMMLNYLTSQPSGQGGLQQVSSAVESQPQGLTDLMHVLTPTTSQSVNIKPKKTVSLLGKKTGT